MPLRVQMALKLDSLSIPRHHFPSQPMVSIHVNNPYLPSNHVRWSAKSFPSLAVARLSSTRSTQNHLPKFEDFGLSKSNALSSSEVSRNKRCPSKHFRFCMVLSRKRGSPFKFFHLDNEFDRERGCPVRASATIESATLPLLASKNPQDINVLVVGSTGYIGKFVVKELVKRGYNVIAVARERSGVKGKNRKEETLRDLQGANVCFSDVTELSSLESSLNDLGTRVDVVVSCLASRSGGIKDSWKIDYQATRNSLIAGRKSGAVHFVLLSAICVQKPLLEFQRAKLKFESELVKEAENGELTYSIVRPTAFFKSLGGQVELVKDGKPYVMFGDGRLCACKPISEEDLASFMADCVLSNDKINRILPIGGPGKALTPLEQGEMLFNLLGKEPKFLKVPLGIMDFAIGVLDFLVKIFPSLEDAAEYGKIGRYYAAESMLLLNPETGKYDAAATPSYGTDTLEEFFKRVIREGMAGQELGEQSIF